MAIDCYTVEEWCTKRTLKRGFTVYDFCTYRSRGFKVGRFERSNRYLPLYLSQSSLTKVLTIRIYFYFLFKFFYYYLNYFILSVGLSTITV